MAKTANEELYDAFLRHHIALDGLDKSVRRRVVGLLNDTEADLDAQITRRLRNATRAYRSPRELKRLQTLRRIIKGIRSDAWADVSKVWQQEMTELAKENPKLMADITKTTAPVVVNPILPSSRQMAIIATSKPFQGRVLKDWAKNAEAADLDRIMRQIQIGMVAGEDSAQIARRVVGNPALQGRDGVTITARRNAAAITRTAVTHVANETMVDYIAANADIFERVRFVATLDNRTTVICMGLDGTSWPAKSTEIETPPLHIHCRSVLVPEFNKNGLANRPEKPGPKREIGGSVSANVTYQDWLSRQSVGFQNEVLGPTKAKLFRDGGLPLKKFVSREGHELSIKDLRRFNAEAFKKAGL